jgi:Asp-tRNA(Asn)/Glu-tRNA(Gln) amidotransferase A subunit family amidase
VTDLAIMLDATTGFDPADPLTEASRGHIPRTYLGVIGDRDIGDVRIGILTSLFGTTPEDTEVASVNRKEAPTVS